MHQSGKLYYNVVDKAQYLNNIYTRIYIYIYIERGTDSHHFISLKSIDCYNIKMFYLKSIYNFYKNSSENSQIIESLFLIFPIFLNSLRNIAIL